MVNQLQPFDPLYHLLFAFLKYAIDLDEIMWTYGAVIQQRDNVKSMACIFYGIL